MYDVSTMLSENLQYYHLIFSLKQEGKHLYYPHFIDAEMEVRRDQVAYSSHTRRRVRSKYRWFSSRACVFNPSATLSLFWKIMQWFWQIHSIEMNNWILEEIYEKKWELIWKIYFIYDKVTNMKVKWFFIFYGYLLIGIIIFLKYWSPHATLLLWHIHGKTQ